jgi:DNA-binding MarR family transcriptional regulator
MEAHAPPEKVLSLMSRKLAGAYAFLRRRMAEEGLSGMDVSHGDILFQLYAEGSLGMGELAKRIGKDKSTVTALVKKMEGAGLVRRRSEASDARLSLVELSERGESYRDGFARISAELMETLWRGFSDAEKAALMHLLESLGSSA